MTISDSTANQGGFLMGLIQPGEIKDSRVRTGNKDTLRSSRNGFRTLTVWVHDDDTVLKARWEKECLGGANNWITIGKETVRGRGVKFSRTISLMPTENLKLTIEGVHPSTGKKRTCQYSAKCSEWLSPEARFESPDFDETNTWFRADHYLRWYWCGTTCYLVANVIDKELLIIDAYVSKATIGGNDNFGSSARERRRIAFWLNTIRGFIQDGFKVVGILTSHGHGDHIGDLPYLLGGLKAGPMSHYMGTDVALRGKGQTGRIPVVMSYDAFKNPHYHKKIGGNAYKKPSEADIDFPVFYPEKKKISGTPFSQGRKMQYGRFDITPYIWYHGKLADGLKDERRTLAYVVKRKGQSPKIAKTFITTGYCERSQYIREINKEIPCHHMIFAYSGGPLPAKSARKISLLPRSPVGANYIFAGHTDKNCMTAFDGDDDREKVTDLFSHFLSNRLVSIRNGKTYWRGKQCPIRLGYWGNRIGDC